MNSDDIPTPLAVLVLLVFCLVGAGGAYVKAFYNDHTATCTITDKDRGGGKDSTMRVYTQQCGVLQNSDSWLRGKTDSADVQGELLPGKTYQLEIAGARISLFSSFPNIVRVVDQQAGAR